MTGNHPSRPPATIQQGGIAPVTSRIGVRNGIITARNRNTEYFEVMIRPVSLEGKSNCKIDDGRLALRFMGKTSTILAEYDQSDRKGKWEASAHVQQTVELERHPRTSGFYGQVERLQLVFSPSLHVLRPMCSAYCDLDISSLIDPSSDFSESTVQLAFYNTHPKKTDVQNSVISVTVQFMAWPLPSRRSSGSSSGSSSDTPKTTAPETTARFQQPAPKSDSGKYDQARPACFPWKLSSLWRKPTGTAKAAE